LLSLQSFSLIPTIDKPTRVYKNTATLSDNILVNKLDAEIYSGNIVSDVSDHYSQFCIFQKTKVIRKKVIYLLFFMPRTLMLKHQHSS